jgi:hypothetical protein
MTAESRGDGSGFIKRPLLDAAFLSELERLSEAPRRVLPARRRDGVRPSKRAGRLRINLDRSSVALPEPAETPDAERLPALFRRLFRGERPALHLLIDSSESMEMRSTQSGRRKWDQGCRLAAALGVAARSHFRQVRLSGLDHARGRRSPLIADSPERKSGVFQAIGTLQPGGKGHFLRALDRNLRRSERESVFVVLSDFLSPEWEAGLRLLAVSGRRVFAVQIMDPDDFAQKISASLVLKDADKDSARPLSVPSLLLDGYQESLLDFCGDVADLCAEAGVDYVRITTDEAFEPALIAALRGNRAE